jgi:hypothetical protein
MTTAPEPGPRAVFARPIAFDLACPNCGTVDSVGHGRPWWKRPDNFDRFMSRWECRSCRRVFAIGLAIWPVRRAGNRPHFSNRRPVDTIPNRERLEALRALRGLSMWDTRGWRDPVNVVCSCEDPEQNPLSDCSVHGGDAHDNAAGPAETDAG